VVFDIIHFNGTDLAGYRLQDRLKILENCIVEQNMHLKFIERKPRNTKEEIYSDLEQALLDR
jgi:ATP-dependent DNA ligase